MDGKGLEIVDLSQDIFTGMPVFPGLPDVNISMHVSHEQWDNIADRDVVSPAVNRLELGEHTGTHVDAINHMARQYRGQSISSGAGAFVSLVCRSKSVEAPARLCVLLLFLKSEGICPLKGDIVGG